VSFVCVRILGENELWLVVSTALKKYKVNSACIPAARVLLLEKNQ
jgi:hypothetical protein